MGPMLAGVLLCGCASQPPLVLHQVVGPIHRDRVDDGTGALVVYSATRVTMSDQSEYPVHTAYTIYGPDDRIVRQVDNTSGLFSKDPSTIHLSAGEYRVKAIAVGTGFVVVPVVIEPHETTVVSLDGSGVSQGVNGAHGDTDSWVRLPDGQVVGSKVCNAQGCG